MPDAPSTGPAAASRRQVLCGLLVALAAPAGLAACSAGESGGSGGSAGTPLAQIPVGGGVVVDGKDGPVVLTQPTAGTVKAFSAVCPHQGATVDAPQGGTIVCPRHGSEFDAASGALRKGPAQTGLPEVPARVANGTVTLT